MRQDSSLNPQLVYTDYQITQNFVIEGEKIYLPGEKRAAGLADQQPGAAALTKSSFFWQTCEPREPG